MGRAYYHYTTTPLCCPNEFLYVLRNRNLKFKFFGFKATEGGRGGGGGQKTCGTISKDLMEQSEL